MPVYPGNDLATLLYENRQAFLFIEEPVKVGERSVAFQLRRERGASYPFGVSFEASFSANPGAFEIDIQIADRDEPGAYVTAATLDSANASFTARYDMTNLWPKYVSAVVVALTNAVNVTLMVTR